MRKTLLPLFIFIVSYSFVFGQAIIRGKITDETGETLIGVTVVLKSTPPVAAATDFDGNYTIKTADTSEQLLIVSYISYNTVQEKVRPKKGDVLIKNFVLQSSSKAITEVVVTAKAVRSNENYMQNKKISSATTLDYISADNIKKTGDPNVSAAVARVAGVSTNGGFITVRGIGDRYVKTTINGSRIPTLDPFTNNIKLDLFPASLIDNIIINKTATPDVPGDWAGAYLSIETKDYPENLTINVETAFGYNTQSTFKDVISSQRSSTDWQGYDNGLREHNHTTFVTAHPSVSQYEEFVALGYGDYFKSIGVNGWTNGQNNNIYYRLGLVQLGLLAPASINDDAAFASADKKYKEGPYEDKAFRIINAAVPGSAKSFPSNWNTTVMKAPINVTQSFSIGNQVSLFGNPLGFLFGFRYGNSFQYDPTSTTNRVGVAADANGTYVPTITNVTSQQAGRETNTWSALMNVAYKFGLNHSASFMFMPNIYGVNNVRHSINTADPNSAMITNSQFYDQRKQLIYQAKSEHYIPSIKMKIEAKASYTNGKSSVPDFKNLDYKRDTVPGGYQYLMGNGIGNEIHRYYRYLNENIFDAHAFAEVPLGKKDTASNKPSAIKVKAGGAYQYYERKYDQYDYWVRTSNTSIPNDNIDAVLGPDAFDIHSYYVAPYGDKSKLDYYYVNNTTPTDHSFGNSTIYAGFGMADYTITSSIRLVGGLRIEKASMFTDVVLFDSLKYVSDDPRRGNRLAPNPANRNETNYLPSANIIYKLNKSEDSPMNIRANYSQTVARPSLRELSEVSAFDYELRANVIGNSQLKTVKINNYDLRFESYFKSGDNISFSLFYKDFIDHILLSQSGGYYSWQNVDKSRVAGIELEGRKKITNWLDFRANLTLTQSETSVNKELDLTGDKRIEKDVVGGGRKVTMFGQAPYVINAIIGYNADSIGFSANLSYNIQGARMVILSSNYPFVPDVYELPRHMLDLKLTKKLGKHFSTSFTIRDILNTPIRRVFLYDNGNMVDYDKFTWGSIYQLSFSYKL